MIVIICTKYKRNPSRTVDATERTRFSKSRSNDLEDIGQGQRSSHATHLLMLVIICTKYGKNPSWTVDATGRTRKVNGQTDRRTDRRTDRQTDRVNPIYPPNFVAGGYNKTENYLIHFSSFFHISVLRRRLKMSYILTQLEVHLDSHIYFCPVISTISYHFPIGIDSIDMTLSFELCCYFDKVLLKIQYQSGRFTTFLNYIWSEYQGQPYMYYHHKNWYASSLLP